ncbi:hypothetical protein WICPIJ_007344 [Wickerhamomyces pijperi]|uniref:Spc7 kinetochore protein domain-containing protein n=1 Tax=Wickerhamomyces pijperi TaxID=599730 RepID=A0A9P8Q2M8_WICPI|nr:hypothetical protein WICPIJ_007344 [Wickerhamomyces pijperi]
MSPQQSSNYMNLKEKDKENHQDQPPTNQDIDPAQKQSNSSKYDNRRESLSRGILKPQAPDDTTLQGRRTTIHGFPLRTATSITPQPASASVNQVPNNSVTVTLSSTEAAAMLDEINKKAKREIQRRRVSFAPEVTMHKIDLIPVGSTSNQPQVEDFPKRRETIAVVPHRMADVVGTSSDHPSEPMKVHSLLTLDDDDAREILMDSSDIEEDNEEEEHHIINAEEEHEKDRDGDEEEENMMLTMIQANQVQALKAQTDLIDSDDNVTEQTMDLTQSLTFINRQMAKGKLSLLSGNAAVDQEQQVADADEDRPSQSTNRPFGNITALFDPDESANQSIIEGQQVDMSDDMELTGKYDLRLVKNNPQISTGTDAEAEANAEDEMDMDLTGKFQVREQAGGNVNDEAEDVAIDFNHAKRNTQPVSQASTQAQPNDEEVTMDFTHIFSNISRFPMGVNEEEDQPQQEMNTTANASESDVDLTNKQQEQDGEDEEMTMDLTQTFRPSNTETQQDPIFDEDEEGEQSMEITHLKATTDGAESDEEDENNDEITLMNTQLNRTIANYVAPSQDVLMTSTQLTPSPQPMAVQAPEHLTPIKPKRSHTTETGSPMSSKRRYSSANDDILQQIKTKLNALTPKKPRRESSLDNRDEHTETDQAKENSAITKYQPASEVLAVPEPFVLEEEPLPPSFTPLREASDKRNSLTALDKVSFNLGPSTSSTGTDTATTTMIPLAQAHELPSASVVVDDDYTPVTIQQFFKDLSIEFFGTLDVLDQYQRAFQNVKYPEISALVPTSSSAITDLQYSIARSSNVPWLALSHFSCLEILKNLLELKEFFAKLESEFLQDNPNFVKEYYLAQSFNLQKSLSDHFILMKEYSDQIAEKKLLEWRDMLHQELVIGLGENARKIAEEISQGNETLKQLDLIEGEIIETLKHSNQQLTILREKLQDLETSKSEALITVRTELLHELDSLTEEESQLKSLEGELSQLETQLVDNTELLKEIKTKEQYIQDHKNINFSERLKQDTEQFEWKLQISGIRFIKLINSTIHFSLTHSKIKISYDILDESQRSVIIPESIKKKHPLTFHILNKYIKINHKESIDKFVQGLYSLYFTLVEFERDLFFLGSKYPLSIIHNLEGSDLEDLLQLSLLDYDKAQKRKVKHTFVFNLDQLLQSEGSITVLEPTSVDCQLIYGGNLSKDNSFLKNKFIQDNLDLGFIRQLA